MIEVGIIWVCWDSVLEVECSDVDPEDVMSMMVFGGNNRGSMLGVDLHLVIWGCLRFLELCNVLGVLLVICN